MNKKNFIKIDKEDTYRSGAYCDYKYDKSILIISSGRIVYYNNNNKKNNIYSEYIESECPYFIIKDDKMYFSYLIENESDVYLLEEELSFEDFKIYNWNKNKMYNFLENNYDFNIVLYYENETLKVIYKDEFINLFNKEDEFIYNNNFYFLSNDNEKLNVSSIKISKICSLTYFVEKYDNIITKEMINNINNEFRTEKIKVKKI